MAEYLKNAKSKPPRDEFKRVMDEIRLGEKELEKYNQRVDKIVKRVRDEDRISDSDSNLPPRFNILWSNVETTAPLYFARVPKVQADRRHKYSDPVARYACQIWERATQFSIDNYDFPGVMKALVRDYQLAGRGTAWMRYEPSVDNYGIGYQEVTSDHVHYKDFGHTPAKQWRNVRGVWRKIYLTKKQLKQRFPDIYQDIPLDYAPQDPTDGENRRRPDNKTYQQARIYEYWDSDTMCVYWISRNYNGVLDKLEDPLGLHDFFPTPKPLFGFTTTETLIPVPDFSLYQDQAKELDRITMKIGLLQDALRLVGFYDATYTKELNGLYKNPRMNEMIPIANWQKLQSAGGIKGISEWMSIGEVIEAISALYQDRNQVKQDLYEITGIGDIIRGANSGQEVTATEQMIKGRFASIRVEDRKNEVQRYARDLIAMHGEIIAEHFEPEIIAGMSGANLGDPNEAQMFYQALELLKNDPMRSFRISLETDSMVAVDEALDKQKTTEFVGAFTQLLTGALQVMQGAPMLAPTLGEVMMYTVRRYNAGRGLEDAIEQGMAGLVQMAQQSMSQPPPPNPAMIKAQADMQIASQKAQQEAQLQQQKMQQQAILNQQEAQTKMQIHQDEMRGRMALAQQEAEHSMVLEQRKMENDVQLAREKAQAEMAIKMAEIDHRAKLENTKAVLAAGIPDLHVTPKGTVTTKPAIIKEGEFFHDPISGKRKVRIIEKPLEEDD